MKFFKKAVCLCTVIACLCGTVFPVQAKNGIRRGENCGKKIALTFDDGPHPTQTRKILSILDRYGVKATFFMIGQNVENYPEAAKAVAESGNEIGNHTFSHRHLSKTDNEKLSEEIERCGEKIQSVCGYQTKLFRPPEGVVSETVQRCAGERGYSLILWSIDTRDWETKNAQRIVNEVLKNVQSGDIILMHDYIGKNTKTPEALEILLPKLLALGYEPVTVSELLGIT